MRRASFGLVIAVVGLLWSCQGDKFSPSLPDASSPSESDAAVPSTGGARPDSVGGNDGSVTQPAQGGDDAGLVSPGGDGGAGNAGDDDAGPTSDEPDAGDAVDECSPESACCSSDDCQENAHCGASHTCECDDGFKDCKGHCISDSSCCENADCSANASCSAENQCVCKANYYGENCGYMFLGLSFLSGKNRSVANAISGDGSTVVGSSWQDSGSPTAFRWRAGVMSSLGFLSGGEESEAYAVSGDGSVAVGDAYLGSAARLVGFIWSNNNMSALALAEFGTYTAARGISEDGSKIVGWGDRDGEHRAFIWTNGVPGTHGSIDRLYFRALSADGLVIGGDYASRPTVYQNGTSTEQGSLTGYISGQVLAMTATGSMRAGYLSNSLSDRAVRWSAGGVAKDLGTLSGDSRGLGISGDGAVVVGMSDGQAAIWNETDGMRALGTVLAEAGVDLNNWTLTSATGVSKDGKAIAGYGQHNGATEAFIVRLP